MVTFTPPKKTTTTTNKKQQQKTPKQTAKQHTHTYTHPAGLTVSMSVLHFVGRTDHFPLSLHLTSLLTILVPMGFLQWEIQVAFPGESKL